MGSAAAARAQARRWRARYVALGALVLLGGWALVALVRSVPLEGARVGRPAPEFAVPGLGGGTVTLAAYRGRPVVINFLATWCGPCWRELPAFDDAAWKHQGRGLAVLGIAVRDSREAVQQMVSTLGLSFPIGLDPTGTVAVERYRITGMPVTVFVDRHGVVRRSWTGPLDAGSLDRFIAEIL